MENYENFEKEKRLIETVEQAKTVLSMLLEDSEKLNLERGISGLVEKLKNPNLDLLLESYPELLQEYELKHLLSGSIKITGTTMQDIKAAGLLSCLQLIIHFCSSLRKNVNSVDNDFKSLKYILNSITPSQFISELLIIIISVVGEDYYEKFQQKIQYLNLSIEDAIILENDTELEEHIDFMVWFALVRLFLESTYVYFNSSDEEKLKNTAL